MGDMADEMYDWDDDFESANEEAYRNVPTCKRCGKTGLVWYDVGGVWKLFEYIGLRLKEHVCPPKDHSDAFEDES